jgi:hypothetical protein
MTPPEINKRLAERLGIKPKIFYHYADAPGTEYYPDFCRDPRLVLREMMKREDWLNFAWNYGVTGIAPKSQAYIAYISADDMVDETGKLAMAAITFLEAKR